jgi:hypothetical protein
VSLTKIKELPVVYAASTVKRFEPDGQHTGLTDLPLTEAGEQNARLL